ncbi:MAG TPA: hypothetical protein VM884_00375 [Flavisolibacter sp.]|nr:hypothetical protein [Flavisolibacter sp.]
MKLVVTLVAGLVLLACKKNKSIVSEEVPLSKKVEYHVFAAKDYSDASYQNVKADLRLQIRKINNSTGEMQLIWDRVFATRKIVEFPQYANKLIIEKWFPVLESKEKLNGSLSIRYDYNGLISQVGKGDEVAPGQQATLLEANL